uniref:WAP domain-containing protein n=1 Tax=Paramormyrops kingsleyae TaxID=1676925 RepID=A0A3B3T385_9TELE
IKVNSISLFNETVSFIIQGWDVITSGPILWLSYLVGKPGTCPRSMGELPSKSFCTCDNECPGKMKCCAFNFSYCDLPALGKPVPCRITKAGDTICTANKDCPKGWKCCSNGCGHLCAPPATGNVGKERSNGFWWMTCLSLGPARSNLFLSPGILDCA